MRNHLARLITLLVIAWSHHPSGSWAQGDPPASPSASMTELLRYEPTGLSFLGPYDRDKVPVVFIHGLWVAPASWHRMIASLEADPAIRGRYQFWTFGYSTGDPIPYSAHLLRGNLEEARRKFNPDGSNAAFDRMVLVGHSMGGLIAKMMAIDPGEGLWRVVSDRPFGELLGEKEDIDLFRDGLLFAARPEVRRVIFIATPHRGSHFDRGPIQHVGARLVRIPDPLRTAHHRLVTRNGPAFFRDHFRKSIPSSIDELEWGSPILTGLSGVSTAPAVKVHSIIAVRPDSPPAGRTDGLVSFDSAHVPGVASEKVVSTGHLCQDHPEVIAEVMRILAEHSSS
jgi:pimeloyl-ACP methyl ester carboxylesterase